jgi:hypothetical protein
VELPAVLERGEVIHSTAAFADIQPALHGLAADSHFGKIVLLADG